MINVNIPPLLLLIRVCSMTPELERCTVTIPSVCCPLSAGKSSNPPLRMRHVIQLLVLNTFLRSHVQNNRTMIEMDGADS